MTTAWAHLPNATHIDRVLASLAATPKLWDAARGAAWRTARGTARGAALGAARGAARGAAWDPALDAAWRAARDAAWGAAWDAVAALIAWDDCGVFLDMPPDVVRLVAASGNHPAILLLPAAIVFSPAT